jgi:hypothetical protein
VPWCFEAASGWGLLEPPKAKLAAPIRLCKFISG